ncbi:MAG: glycosyltransferase family 2 protein [Pyrinomonadaceae bacterium]
MTHKTKESSTEIHVAIVLPFLNEQETLANTCRSLGFGMGTNSTPRSATLFLIDNGSTDGSADIAKQVKGDTLDGRVVIGYEPELGYVPPRHRGNMMVRAFARSTDRGEHDVLILQADADTQYDDGYIEGMRSVMQANGANVLVEACTDYPPDFKAEYPAYIQLCDRVDKVFAELFAPPAADVIVDDKVSGYRLDNYFGWGGHQREYAASSGEIHAETSRLYMKARTKGAERVPVDSALAYPSLRKVLQEPALHFASAGFPREASWNEKWRETYSGPTTIDDFCYNISHPEVQRAIQVREQHLIAIFSVLPIHVNNSIKEIIAPEISDLTAVVLPLLPKRTIDDLAHGPSLFISDVFELIECHGIELLSECRRLIATIPRP